MEIALFQPDIPQNTGTILRLSACFDVRAHIIKPTGFVLHSKDFRRAAMDYLSEVDLIEHLNFAAFEAYRTTNDKRLILLTTHAPQNYLEFEFQQNDILIFGRESSGVPDFVHQAADHRLRIPMKATTRSINLAMSVALVTGEALRQTGKFPIDM